MVYVFKDLLAVVELGLTGIICMQRIEMQLNLFTAKHKSKQIQIKGKLNESQIKTGRLTGKSENRKGKLKVEKAN